MSDDREIRFRGKNLGSIDLNKLSRMVKSGEIDITAEFLSALTNSWLPLSWILEDFPPSRAMKLEQMRNAGITKVSLLGAGEDCPVCKELCKGAYPIDSVPDLPPWNCECVPWCRVEILAEE